jgi:hypothetical protein
MIEDNEERGASSPGPMPALGQLLALEDDRSFVEDACPVTGIPLWTVLRQPVLRMYGAGRFYTAPLIDSSYRLAADFQRKAEALTKAIGHNRRRLPALRNGGAITISASGAGIIPRPGGLFNRLSDYFALERPDEAVVIEDFFGWRWPFPRVNDRVLFRAPIQAELAVRGRLFEHRHLSRAAGFVDRVGRRLRDTQDVDLRPADRQWLTMVLARWLHTAPHEVRRYETLFRKLGTRVLLKEEGSYGHAAPMIVAAKRLGIATAEYQHGVVNGNHDSYNFAPAIHASSAYRHTLPAFFLSYGRWWEDQVDAPLAKVTIGSPHRTESLVDWAPEVRRDILILGEGFDREFYLDFCRRLMSGRPSELRVVFRPHPLERQQFADPAYRERWAGIDIDEEKDVYVSLRRCAALIGEMSTVLFEAIGLVDRIFLFDTEKAAFSLPRHPFEKFADADDLLGKLGREAGPNPIDAEEYWASGWQRRYDEFLCSLGSMPGRSRSN